MINFMTLNTMAQNTLPHTSNMGYQARGAYRIETAIPEDRKIDYWYRDMLIPLFATYGMDMGIRLSNYLLAFPAYAKALELDKLTELYKDQGFKNLRNYNYKDLSQPGVLQAIRERIISASRGGASYGYISKLFKELEMPNLSPTQKEEAKVLVHHLKRRLNYPDYMKDVLGIKGAAEHQLVQDSVKLISKIDEAIENKVLSRQEGGVFKRLLRSEKRLESAKTLVLGQKIWSLDKVIQLITPLSDKATKKEILENKTIRDELAQQAKRVLEASSDMKQKSAIHVKELLKSKAIVQQLKRIKNINFWPQMAVNVVYSLIVLGLISSAIDVKKVQPWQSDLVKQGYDSGIIMKPAYLSFIPAIGAFVLAHKSKALQKLGYMTHFNITWAVALATYGAFSFLWTKHRIENTEPTPPVKEKVEVKIPEGFQEVPLNRDNRFNAFSTVRPV